ncbi:hypothetical protein [Amycolatopsis sp. cmx-11-12]|uniref:hypothetical protein n=1 Tax=Amycolatopsis sp. cmx-11-12 TaxID=2785795 RepID=UPI003916DB74
MLRRYSDKTISCYRACLAHYQHWCHIRSYQTGTTAITTAKLLVYVGDQITRWDDTRDQDTEDYPKYRPDAIRQTTRTAPRFPARFPTTAASGHDHPRKGSRAGKAS